jgi:small subunit ribosomal protein S4
MVFKKGMSLSPLHSRQLIVHGHVTVGDRVITIPGYEVGSQEEGGVKLTGREEAPSAPAQSKGDHQEAPAEEQPAQAK